MKKVLITGKTSYIGQSLKNYVQNNYSEKVVVNSISVRGNEWRDFDFSGYDVIIHLAALVHKNEKKSTLYQYETVNRDLTVEVAKKAKLAHVNHFIFFSTIAVYGNVENSKISRDSLLNPVTKYGISKLEAEDKLQSLKNEKFKVSVIRPPMVYGPNCPGNYNRLSELSHRWGIYPKVKNQRSMIYIGNLCEFLIQLIFSRNSGIFLPQNINYVSTSNLICVIRRCYGRKTIFVPGFNYFLKFMVKHNSIFNKIYGSLQIDLELSLYNFDYNIVDFVKSVKRTESLK